MRRQRNIPIPGPARLFAAAVTVCAAIASLCLTVGNTPADARDHAGFRLPRYETFTLQNGLTVYLMEQRRVPLVYVSALFPAGAANDAGKPGLAYLTAEALLFGTRSYTKAQIEDRLEYLGARCYTWAGSETAGVSLSFLNTDLDQVFPLFKDVVQRPAFDPGEFEKRKKRLLLELVQQKERPSAVLETYFEKFLFGPHGYGNPVHGTRASVMKIGSRDAKAFYDAHYRPEESALVIVGDFETGPMKRRVQELFSSWTAAGKRSRPAYNPPNIPDRRRVLLVNKSDAAETQFAIGTLGIPRNHPDYVAVQVVNTAFGGRFTSLLSDALRISSGLTYGASSSFNTYRNSGSFIISSFTSTENTFKAVDLALAVLDRLHTEGLDEATLTSTKAYLVGQFPTQYETPGSLAGLLGTMFFYGIDDSFVNDYRQQVESVTPAKAREIIARHFPRDRLQMVLIGKASELRDHAGRYGEIHEKEIKSDGF